MQHHMKFCPVSFGLAVGLTWGLGMLLMGLAAMCLGWGTEFIALVGSMYIGFAPTLMGVIFGTVWGFIDGFVGGFLIAWFYNFIMKRCSKACHADKE